MEGEMREGQTGEDHKCVVSFSCNTVMTTFLSEMFCNMPTEHLLLKLWLHFCFRLKNLEKKEKNLFQMFLLFKSGVHIPSGCRRWCFFEQLQSAASNKEAVWWAQASSCYRTPVFRDSESLLRWGSINLVFHTSPFDMTLAQYLTPSLSLLGWPLGLCKYFFVSASLWLKD